MKYIKMAFFLIITICPNMCSQPYVILICGIGALIMYILSERENEMSKTKILSSDSEISELKKNAEISGSKNELKLKYTNYRISCGNTISTYINAPHTIPIYTLWHDLPFKFNLLEILQLIEMNCLSKETIEYLENHTDFKQRKNELNTNIRTISK